MKVEIFIGSNATDRNARVEAATSFVIALLTDVSISEIIETPDYEGNEAMYANRLIVGNFSGEIEHLRDLLNRYESDNGRKDGLKGQIVTIDLDLAKVDGKILKVKETSSYPYALCADSLQDVSR